MAIILHSYFYRLFNYLNIFIMCDVLRPQLTFYWIIFLTYKNISFIYVHFFKSINYKDPLCEPIDYTLIFVPCIKKYK